MPKPKAYFQVFALKNDIIWLATQERKPGRSRTWGEPQIDEDGIFSWLINTTEQHESMTPHAKVAKGTTIATYLNVRRIIREHVEPRLSDLSHQISAVQDALNRIERKLDEVTLPSQQKLRS